MGKMRKLGISDSYEMISGAPYYDEFENFKGTIELTLDITEKMPLIQCIQLRENF